MTGPEPEPASRQRAGGNAESESDNTLSRRAIAGQEHPGQAAQLILLQQAGGNRAAASILGARLQRQHQAQPAAPSTADRLSNLERQQALLEKRQALTELDLRWGRRFGEKLSSWRQAILRISGGLEAAQSGFQRAQVEQQQFDALVTQLFLAAVSVGFAAGFEPFLAVRLGRAGKTADEIKEIIERVENPAVQAVGSSGNIAGALPQNASSTPDPADGISGSPVAFLTENLESVEHHNQAIDQAFGARAGGLHALSDEKLGALDVQAQEGVYQGLFDRLSAAARGVEDLKPPAEIATVLERHIWARWLREHGRIAKTDPMEGSPRPSQIQPEDVPTMTDVSVAGFGSYIEDRLNVVGVSPLAGVTLTGHWYSPNHPDDWSQVLVTWAFSYAESITATRS